jgi:hypothetical protein
MKRSSDGRAFSSTTPPRRRGVKVCADCVSLVFFLLVIAVVADALSSSSSDGRHSCPAVLEGKPQSLAIQSAVSAGILIDESKGKGLGAFATESIVRGEWIGDYSGEILTVREVRARYWKLEKRKKEDRRWRKSRTRRGQGMSGDYLFSLSDDIFIDGEDTDASGWCRYMNHAAEKNPACNVRTHHDPGTVLSNGEDKILPKLWFTATRNIVVGEELLYDYGDDYWNGSKEKY